MSLASSTYQKSDAAWFHFSLFNILVCVALCKKYLCLSAINAKSSKNLVTSETLWFWKTLTFTDYFNCEAVQIKFQSTFTIWDLLGVTSIERQLILLQNSRSCFHCTQFVTCKRMQRKYLTLNIPGMLPQ